MATGSKIAAKVAGKVKGAAKAMAGYPKIFHHLSAEHAEVSTLMERISASDESSNARQEIFPEIRKNLLAHAHAEEKEFYPVLRRFPELATLVGRCLEDHKRIQAYLEELDAAGMTASSWTTLFE